MREENLRVSSFDDFSRTLAKNMVLISTDVSQFQYCTTLFESLELFQLHFENRLNSRISIDPVMN